LLHELRVHQFELEIQNEELKHSQIALELSLEKYFKLHDIAPIGYCTLNVTGLVMEANLKACELFGLDRIYLKRQPFSSFIFKDDLIIHYIAKYILSCHENWDGSGYPQGLSKEEIPLLSRIMAIADSYDVMTSKRTYKSAMSKDDAVKELERCAGTQFDPALVEKFIEVIAE